MEENVVTENQMLEAMDYVRSYVKFNGGDPFDIDWEKKPKFLPEDVSRAWDTYLDFWQRMQNKNIIP